LYLITKYFVHLNKKGDGSVFLTSFFLGFFLLTFHFISFKFSRYCQKYFFLIDAGSREAQSLRKGIQQVVAGFSLRLEALACGKQRNLKVAATLISLR